MVARGLTLVGVLGRCVSRSCCCVNLFPPSRHCWEHPSYRKASSRCRRGSSGRLLTAQNALDQITALAYSGTLPSSLKMPVLPPPTLLCSFRDASRPDDRFRA